MVATALSTRCFVFRHLRRFENQGRIGRGVLWSVFLERREIAGVGETLVKRLSWSSWLAARWVAAGRSSSMVVFMFGTC